MFPARSLLTMVALVAATGGHGCLLDRQVVGGDAEVSLLTPTALVHDPTKTTPPPGSLIVLPRGTDSKVLRITVARADRAELQVRAWFNRPRPCDATTVSNCNRFPVTIFQTIGLSSEGGELRPEFVLPVTVPSAEPCMRLDVYISPRFRNEAGYEHEPERAFDVVHARYFFVREPANEGDPYPSVATCANDFREPTP